MISSIQQEIIKRKIEKIKLKLKTLILVKIERNMTNLRPRLVALLLRHFKLRFLERNGTKRTVFTFHNRINVTGSGRRRGRSSETPFKQRGSGRSITVDVGGGSGGRSDNETAVTVTEEREFREGFW